MIPHRREVRRPRLRALAGGLHKAFHEPDTRQYRYVQGTVWTLILTCVLLLVIEALLPVGGPAGLLLQAVDRVLLSIFAVEILLRVGSYRPPALDVFRRPPMGRLRTHLRGRLQYLLRPIMLVDIVAVLALFPELRGLRALRLLRTLGSNRLFRYHNPFAIVLQAFEENGGAVHAGLRGPRGRDAAGRGRACTSWKSGKIPPSAPSWTACGGRWSPRPPSDSATLRR